MASTSTTSNNNPPPMGNEGGATSGPVAGGVAGGEAPATKKKRSRLFCSYCKKANHTSETCRLVPGTITILSGGGQLAPDGCTFRLATGRIEKKKNKKNNKKKKANEKLADHVSKEVEKMQLEE